MHVATGAILRGCEAFKAEKDLYPTAYCTDPQTGAESKQKITSDWQRIAAGADRCDPCRPPLPRNAPEVPREAPDVPPPIKIPSVTASRIFASPNQYPPREFAAYGILAFPSRPSPYDRDRHLMICNEYVATLPRASELAIPPATQMVTVWPVNSDYYSNWLNQLLNQEYICQIAVDNYDLVFAQQALKDAEIVGVNTTGTGPFLLAWSPATDKGKRDALVLVSDLSDVMTYEQAHKIFLAWSRDIERDPKLWSNGWNIERLRSKIRYWVDKYGSKSLAVFGVKG